MAALFDVHPMHVESVAWAIERKDVLMAFFGLLALHAYVGYVQCPGWRPYLWMVIAFLASLLAKPMLITLPLVLLLLDFWPLRRPPFRANLPNSPTSVNFNCAIFRQQLHEKSLLFIIAFICAILTMELPMVPTFVTIPLSSRVMNAFSGYGWYLSTTFYPTELGIFYPHPYRGWSWVRGLAGAGGVRGGDDHWVSAATRPPLVVHRVAVVRGHARSRDRPGPKRGSGVGRSIHLLASHRIIRGRCLGDR